MQTSIWENHSFGRKTISSQYFQKTQWALTQLFQDQYFFVLFYYYSSPNFMLSTLHSHQIWPKHSLSPFFSIECPEFLSWGFSFLSAAQLSGLCSPHHAAMTNHIFQQPNINTEDEHSKSHNSMSHTGPPMLIKREFIKLDFRVSSTPNLLWMQPYSSKQTKWSLQKISQTSPSYMQKCIASYIRKYVKRREL